jgi:hypothetical protein
MNDELPDRHDDTGEIPPEQTKDVEKADKEEKWSQEESLQRMQEDIELKRRLITEWAEREGLVVGKDIKLISEEKPPHKVDEGRLFAVVLDKHYVAFQRFIESEYVSQIRAKKKDADIRLNYSWAGRFCVEEKNGAPIDTGAASSIEKMEAPSHQQEFEEYFKETQGFEFPKAVTINAMLRDIATKALSTYREALKGVEEKKAWEVKGRLKWMIELLEDSLSGNPCEDLPEIMTDEMPNEQRIYADLTYNTDDLPDLGKVQEITGVDFPDNIRVDKIMDNLSGGSFDGRAKMDNVCRDFNEWRAKRGGLAEADRIRSELGR